MSAPPAWAETLLRTVIPAEEFEPVAGDLLEAYRDTVLPRRGRWRAKLWYVTQVIGFIGRTASAWAALLGGAFVARTAFDWLVPVGNLQDRAAVSTALTALILVSAGAWASWRSGLLAAGPVAGVATTIGAAVISLVGSTGLLMIWHDAHTMDAIRASGGLLEVFVLPLVLILPGVVLGSLGGAIASICRARSAP